jgi:hypothetical protein
VLTAGGDIRATCRTCAPQALSRSSTPTLHEDRGKVDCRTEEVSGKSVLGKLVSCERTGGKCDDRVAGFSPDFAVGSSTFQGGSVMHKVLVFLDCAICIDEAATLGGYP